MVVVGCRVDERSTRGGAHGGGAEASFEQFFEAERVRLFKILFAITRGRHEWTAFLRAEHPEFHRVVERSNDLDPASVRELQEQLPQYLELYGEWVNGPEG